MRTGFVTALAAAILALPGADAAAGPPHCPPGHAKKGLCEPRGSRDAGEDAYREGYRDGRHDARRLERGDRLSRTRYVVIEEPRRYGLDPAPRGRAWVRVDDRVFLVALGTGLIVEALR